MVKNLLKASVADGGMDVVEHVGLCSLDIICGKSLSNLCCPLYLDTK